MARSRTIAFGVLLGLMAVAGCGGNTNSGSGGAGGGGATAGSGGAGGSGATAGSGGAGGSGATAGSGGVGGNCGASARSCAKTSNCMLTEASCCVCGNPTLSDYVAINKAHQNACVCQGPACGCASAANPYLGATCKSGTCSGFDVQQIDALSACNSDADCMLRIGLGCCPGCQAADGAIIALRTDAEAALEKLVCDAGIPPQCPGCIPSPPSNKHAACLQGRCQVVTQ